LPGLLSQFFILGSAQQFQQPTAISHSALLKYLMFKTGAH
jgi:hypothetical protein